MVDAHIACSSSKIEVHIGIRETALYDEGFVEQRLMVQSLCLKHDKFLWIFEESWRYVRT